MSLTDEDIKRVMEAVNSRTPKVNISNTVSNWWPVVVAVVGLAVMWGSLNAQVVTLQSQLNDTAAKLSRVEEILTNERVSGDRWTAKDQDRYEAAANLRLDLIEGRLNKLENHR